MYEALAYYHYNPEETREVEADRQQVAEGTELLGKTRMRFLLDENLGYEVYHSKPFYAFTRSSSPFSTTVHHVFSTAIVTRFGG